MLNKKNNSKNASNNKSRMGKIAISTFLLTPVLIGISSTVSYSMWSSSTQVDVDQATINLDVPVNTITWGTNNSAELYDGKSTELNFNNLTGKYSNVDADNTETSTGWIYRSVVVKPVADRGGTLNITTKSGTPVLSGMTPIPSTTVVPTKENIRLVSSAAECSNDVNVVNSLTYKTNATWSGNATAGLVCITQRRELLVTRNGTVTFEGRGTADQPDRAAAPNPTNPTNTISATMPVLKDMGADQIVSTFRYDITAGSQAGKC